MINKLVRDTNTDLMIKVNADIEPPPGGVRMFRSLQWYNSVSRNHASVVVDIGGTPVVSGDEVRIDGNAYTVMGITRCGLKTVFLSVRERHHHTTGEGETMIEKLTRGSDLPKAFIKITDKINELVDRANGMRVDEEIRRQVGVDFELAGSVTIHRYETGKFSVQFKIKADDGVEI